jgi:aldehyde dehydrogenase (NAD+)
MAATDRSHPFLNDFPKRLLIGGKWVAAGDDRQLTTFDPSTGEPLGQLADATTEDVDNAVTAARRAFEFGWSRTKPFERQNLLLGLADLIESNFDELARLDSIDYGGPISRTSGLLRRALALVRYYAGQATTIHGETIENSVPGDILSHTIKEPLGVVAAIIPWNSPLTMTLWKLGPILAAGCTVVLKPAPEASLVALRIGELVEEAGFPAGVVNIVTGTGEAGAALASHPGVDKVTFTGSTATGQAIIRASANNIKRVSLELGGKSPNIIFADADLETAVPGAALAVFANSGQICSAGTRLYVHDNIYEEFVGRFVEFTQTLKVGDSLDPSTQLGPVVSRSQLSRVLKYIDVGQKEGATLKSGTVPPFVHQHGYFVPPAIFCDVSADMTISREEIFGPVVGIARFSKFEDVIALSNKTEFGLGAGVWTQDLRTAHRAIRSLRAGSVWVNCYQAMDVAVPFGGYKMSGYGRESGYRHVEDYVNVKSAFINLA